MSKLPHRSLLLLISAPSGAGKTTLCQRLIQEFPHMSYSVSYTTRAPRLGELHGSHYFFITLNEFQRHTRDGAFLETAQVHTYFYGTPRAPVLDALNAGRDIIMDIDVQGANKIREAVQRDSDPTLKRAYVDIFIMPPSLEVLRRRLTNRAQDAPTVIETRLNNAAEEMRHATDYQYLIVNDDLAKAYDELRSIVLAEHCRIMP